MTSFVWQVVAGVGVCHLVVLLGWLCKACTKTPTQAQLFKCVQ